MNELKEKIIEIIKNENDSALLDLILKLLIRKG